MKKKRARKLRIQCDEPNDPFAAWLPQDAVVLRCPTSCDSELLWHLIQFGREAFYQRKAFDRALLACRWRGKTFNRREPVSAFLLHVPDGVVVENGFSYESFELISWVMVQVVD